MKALFFISAFLLSNICMAAEKSLHAHEHGAVKVGMAIDKTSVEIDMDGPAESFLGFEYAPKTEKEKKLLNDLKRTWAQNLGSLISFDKALNCKVSESNVEHVIESGGTHSEIEATAKLSCTGKLAGSKASISLKKAFKHIKKLSVEVLSAETKSVEITKDVQVISL